MHLWDFFDRYPKSEIALSSINHGSTISTQSSTTEVKILAILGDSTGIDIQKDREQLDRLPNARVTFLPEPHRQDLNDQLWSQSWDILFFAGHSSSGDNREDAHIRINKTDSISILRLKPALRRAIEQGLKLAIFNSCDGLGLAAVLSDLNIPQVIIMREPVPDQVAQRFLKDFLASFSSGVTFYQAVREAREQLHILEDQFPCAAWMPVISQNPAAESLFWHNFYNS